MSKTCSSHHYRGQTKRVPLVNDEDTSPRSSSAKSSPARSHAFLPSSNDNSPRLPKRRKTAESEGRTTEYLDLSGSGVKESELPQLQRLLSILHQKRRIVVIAGAGISVSAGIPDFRSPTGLFNTPKKHKLKFSGKDLFNVTVYQDGASISAFHDMVRTLSQRSQSAKPTAFHHLLATLAQQGRLMRLYTQNIDGIDISLPPLRTEIPLCEKGPWPKTIQLHGGLGSMVCSKYHTITPFDAEQFNGPTLPPCPTCEKIDGIRMSKGKRSHGIGWLRPRIVLYGGDNPDDEAIGSCTFYDMGMIPDAVIVVGTTLTVPGVRRIVCELCNIVRDRKDGVTVWLNEDPEPAGKDLQGKWDLVVKGPCDEVARRANMRRWDDKSLADENLNKASDKQRAEVTTGTPRKLEVLRNASRLTPGQSPHVLPLSFNKDEPDTPPKKGIKRKADARMELSGEIVTRAQPKKMAASKSKANKGPKKTNLAINNVFKASKPIKGGSEIPLCGKERADAKQIATQFE
jgi:NAD-dependent histone deacetylase SIR2